MVCVLGLHGQDFGSGRATGVASVRRCQKLPLRTIEPMAAGSKMHPPLAKAKPRKKGGVDGRCF